MGFRALAVVGLAAIALAAAVLGVASGREPHPLHTSMAEVVAERETGMIRVSLRVFADDFTAAAALRGTRNAAAIRSPADDPLADYARHSLVVSDFAGKPIAMGFCGARLVGDMIWICLRGADLSRGRGIRIESRVLFDQFDDQVNVVRATYSGRTSTLLFTPGDRSVVVR